MLSLDVIPSGIYCYGLDKKGTIRVCPYWRKYSNGASCELLRLVSIDTDIDNLIWDQVKECGINKGEDDG